ncbi:DUF6000 family protein [Nonomuraea sp. NPDC050790]|uniref:DUF6000 family protein n=1 Tax=Nonomuraea sp. NPDC050790 TaxID=3364371 RepID=UPI00379D70B7
MPPDQANGHHQALRHAGPSPGQGRILESKLVHAGAGYCFALARFAEPRDVEILTAYLDHYLPRLDCHYALLHRRPRRGALSGPERPVVAVTMRDLDPAECKSSSRRGSGTMSRNRKTSLVRRRLASDRCRRRQNHSAITFGRRTINPPLCLQARRILWRTLPEGQRTNQRR